MEELIFDQELIKMTVFHINNASIIKNLIIK